MGFAQGIPTATLYTRMEEEKASYVTEHAGLVHAFWEHSNTSSLIHNLG